MASNPGCGRPLDKRVRLGLELAGRITESGVPGLLWGVVSQEDVLGTLVLLHQKKLAAAIEGYRPGEVPCARPLEKLLTEPYFADLWRQHPNTLLVAEALSNEALPENAEPSGGGPWERPEWGVMRRITAALRGALYGAPLAAATTQADAFKQELVAAALLGAAGDVAEVLSLELEAVHQQQPGRFGLPIRMLDNLTFTLHTISTCIYWVMSGPRRALAVPALQHLAGIMARFITCTPVAMCQLGDPQRLANYLQMYSSVCDDPSEQTSSSTSGAASAQDAAAMPYSSGMPGAWSRLAGSRSQHSGEPAQSSRQARGKQPLHASPPQLPTNADEAMSGALTRVGRLFALNARSMMVSALRVFLRAVHLLESHADSISELDGPWIGPLIARCSEWIRTLHLHHTTPTRPITEPEPAARQPSQTTGRPLRHTSNSMNSMPTPPFYIQGNAWVTGTYSLGPADAAAAGASGLALFVQQLKAGSMHVTAQDALQSLQLLTTMTKLAREMVAEASDPTFGKGLLSADAPMSWATTTAALCKAARSQFMYINLKSGSSQRQQPLDPVIGALVPVLSAAALPLAHAALGCMCMLESKVLKAKIVGTAEAHTLLPVSTAVDLTQAVWECIQLYRQVTTTAAAPSPAAAGSETSLQPPGFDRHCAAVAVWGNNLRSIWELALIAINLSGRGDVKGSARCLASWLPGTAEEAICDILDCFKSTTIGGLKVLIDTPDGDLAGWLGDLAPRGDLTSSQLLYRLCGLYEACLGLQAREVGLRNEGMNAQKVDLLTMQRVLLPLLALVCEIVPAAPPAPAGPMPTTTPAAPALVTAVQAPTQAVLPRVLSPSSSAVGQGRGTQAVSDAGSSNSSSSSGTNTTSTIITPSHVSSPPKHQQRSSCKPQVLSTPRAARTQNQLVAALAASPSTLTACLMPDVSPEMRAIVKRVYTIIGGRLQVLSCTAGTASPLQQVLSHLESLIHGTQDSVASLWSLLAAPEEPLRQFLRDRQVSAWEEAWAVQYRPKEEAVHARLLDEYVRAAAERAARQQPSLAEGLQACLGG